MVKANHDNLMGEWSIGDVGCPVHYIDDVQTTVCRGELKRTITLPT